MAHQVTIQRLPITGSYVAYCTCGWADAPTGEIGLAEMAEANHLLEVRRSHNLSQVWAVDPEEF